MSQPPLLPSERPASVGLAVKLILLTLLLGIPRSFLEWSNVRAQLGASPYVSTEMMATFVVVVTVVVMAFMLWLLWMIGKGRNWARLTYLVLFLIGLPFSIPPLVRTFSEVPLSASIGVLQLIIQVAAVVLLFGADAKRWFNPPPSAPPAPPM